MIYSLIDPIDFNPNQTDYAIDTLSDDYYVKPISDISNKHRKFIFTASKIASKSNLNNKHGCVIVHRGKILSTGYNCCHYNNHNIHTRHAEFDCISKIKKIRNKNKILLSECSLYVVRINDENNLKNSKPCNKCFEYIIKSGIKKIYYSD